MIIGGSSSQDLAASVARELGEELCYVETRKFPDGERYLRITEDVEGKEVTVIQSTGYPQDENLMELLFMVSNLKDLGANTFFFCYEDFTLDEVLKKSNEIAKEKAQNEKC